MTVKHVDISRGRMLFAILAATLTLGISAAQAADVPASAVANPDVYKLLGESADYRVYLATWKAHQRDAFHSHPTSLVAYSLTDCHSRVHTPDGKSVERTIKAGTVNFSGAIPSHAFENLSDHECRVLIVEKK